jgi:cell division protein FtsQ
MAHNKKYTFKKILTISVWVLLGSGIVVLLVAAITRKNSEQITGIQINISGVQNNYFIDKKDVIKILAKASGKPIDKAIASTLDLAAMESALQKDQWIKKAEIFFDNNNVLQVKIAEREPVVRIFTTSGASFYMDSSLTRLPLSDKFSARLPVFTNFPTDVLVLTKADSILLKEIKTLSEFIGSDPFWMAQIDQVDITPVRTFEIIPKLGNQVIRFGSAENYGEKFNKLLAFYKQVQTRIGWNRYSVIDLQFKNQVIGINRDAKEIKMDSLRTIAIMKAIIADAQKRSSDSTSIQLTQPDNEHSNINNSPVIDNLPDENAVEINDNVKKNSSSGSVAPVHVPEKPVLKNPEPAKAKPLIKPPISSEKPGSQQVKKVVVKKPDLKKEGKKEVKKEVKKVEEPVKQEPKAVMPAKTDY